MPDVKNNSEFGWDWEILVMRKKNYLGKHPISFLCLPLMISKKEDIPAFFYILFFFCLFIPASHRHLQEQQKQHL